MVTAPMDAASERGPQRWSLSGWCVGGGGGGGGRHRSPADVGGGVNGAASGCTTVTWVLKWTVLRCCDRCGGGAVVCCCCCCCCCGWGWAAEFDGFDKVEVALTLEGECCCWSAVDSCLTLVSRRWWFASARTAGRWMPSGTTASVGGAVAIDCGSVERLNVRWRLGRRRRRLFALRNKHGELQ